MATNIISDHNRRHEINRREHIRTEKKRNTRKTGKIIVKKFAGSKLYSTFAPAFRDVAQSG